MTQRSRPGRPAAPPLAESTVGQSWRRLAVLAAQATESDMKSARSSGAALLEVDATRPESPSRRPRGGTTGSSTSTRNPSFAQAAHPPRPGSPPVTRRAHSAYNIAGEPPVRQLGAELAVLHADGVGRFRRVGRRHRRTDHDRTGPGRRRRRRRRRRGRRWSSSWSWWSWSWWSWSSAAAADRRRRCRGRVAT